MPFRPQHSLLRVEVPALHSIDTSSVENLFGMWSLFSKTSHAMEDGKRLENLSWRLWNRETFCCNAQSRSRSQSPHFPFARTTSDSTRADEDDQHNDLPPLSSSLDSASSHEGDDNTTTTTPTPLRHDTTASTLPHARPELRRDTRNRQSRGREKHITANDLANIVASIKRTQSLEPIELPLPTPSHDLPERPRAAPADAPSTLPPPSSSYASSSTPQAIPLESSSSTVDTNADDEDDNHGSPAASSEASSNTEMSTHSVIRGFVPGGAPSSYRSQTNLAAQPTPILKTPHKFRSVAPKKRGPMFTIGTSSGEDESSFESHMYKSSLSESLKRTTSDGGRKQTSFREELAATRAAGAHSPVFETDEEDEEVSESAIEDDDDSSDWEDSEDASRPSSVTEKGMFQRVDSRPDLTSRRSLLTTLMHEPDRARALANAASRSTPAMRRSRTTTPNGPSVATSPESGHQMPAPPAGGFGAESSRAAAAAGAQPIIMTTSNTHPIQMTLALSPRTTRRNMLSTELTESLRKNLLWERQHRSSTNLAALRRHHTSTDVKNLRQQPDPGPVMTNQNGAKRFSNDYFHQGLQEYHVKGW